MKTTLTIMLLLELLLGLAWALYEPLHHTYQLTH